MSSITALLRDGILDHFFAAKRFPFPERHYLALFLADPKNNPIELDAAGYRRQRVQFERENERVVNASRVTWDTATENWGIVSHWGVFTEPRRGEPFLVEPMTLRKVVNTGDRFFFDRGGVVIALNED